VPLSFQLIFSLPALKKPTQPLKDREGALAPQESGASDYNHVVLGLVFLRH
jgi:hypothetical protein